MLSPQSAGSLLCRGAEVIMGPRLPRPRKPEGLCWSWEPLAGWGWGNLDAPSVGQFKRSQTP